MFHRRFPEVKISPTTLENTYHRLGIKFKYIQRIKKEINFSLDHYREMFIKMDRLLKLTRLYGDKIVFLDEAVFTFNTFRTKAWSSSSNSISVKDSAIKLKT